MSLAIRSIHGEYFGRYAACEQWTIVQVRSSGDYFRVAITHPQSAQRCDP